MDNVLEIKSLNMFFGKYQALYDINLNIKKGNMVALVGESGCGKTMTAMSILRLIPKQAKIDADSILFYNDENPDGLNLLELNKKDMQNIRGNKIVLVPQDPMTSLNPLYTIENQLIEAIRAHSKVSHHQALRKAKEVMDLVKIPDIENKIKFYPHEFSGGMKQRIIIAMALSGNPDLIIADEPTTALDVTIQKQIMDLIHEIKNEYRTSILLISHDLALVSNYADKISVMYSGHIVEEAPKNLFFKNPIHPYSNALLNSLPAKNPLLKLKTIEGAPPNIQEEILGCKFNPRCSFFKDGVCNKETPILQQREDNHLCACFVK